MNAGGTDTLPQNALPSDKLYTANVSVLRSNERVRLCAC